MQGAGCRVQGSGSRVQGSGFRARGIAVTFLAGSAAEGPGMVGSGSVYASTVAGSGEDHTFAGIVMPAPSASSTALR